MAQVMLFCENCGTPCPSGMWFNGGIASVGSIIANRPCRVCGGRCSISDVVFVNVGGALRLIAGAVRSREELRELSELLEEARRRQLSPDEIMDFLRNGGAEWQGLWDLLGTLLFKNRGDILAILGLILSALPFIQPEHQLTAEEVEKIVQKAIISAPERLQAQHPKAQQDLPGAHTGARRATTDHHAGKHVSRNAPCPCSSGKRHKDCCGSLKGK